MINLIRSLTVLFIFIIFLGTHVDAEEGHDHNNAEAKVEHAHDDKETHDEDQKHKHADEDHKESGDEGKHGHGKAEKGHGEEGHDEGGHGEEGGAKVGPDKGITEKSENGFKLSKDATVAFDLKYDNVSASEIELARSAVVYIKNGKFVYRVRNEWIQRVPITIIFESTAQVKVQSKDLQSGDRVITSGTGFVRGAELILSEGATHSH